MLSGGVRLALLVAVPMIGALLTHELGQRPRAARATAVAAIAAMAALALSLAGSVTAGGAVERTFASAIPGVDLTVRGDSTSITVMLIALLAAALAMPHAWGHPGRLGALLLELAGTAVVATAGTLVQSAAGVEVVAMAALLPGLSRRHRLAGVRTPAVLAVVVGAAGVGLVTAAAQLIAQAGSSDLAVVPASAIGAAAAIPWALAGGALLVAPTLAAPRSRVSVTWASVAAVPSGFLVLLRLQDTAATPLPTADGVTLGLLGAAVALAGARAALASETLPTAARAALGVLTGLLIAEFAVGPVAQVAILAGLFLGLELGWLAAPGWTRQPTAWSAASAALVALPGGATAAFALVAVGGLAAGGVRGFPELLIFTVALLAAAVGVARRLQSPPLGWRPAAPATVIAVVAGIVGGLVPGLALREVAPALVSDAQRVDIDAGALQVLGAGWAGGYIAVALVLVVVTGAAALLVAGDEPVAAPGAAPEAPEPRPHLGVLLAARRHTRSPQQRVLGLVRGVDHWLEAQPQLATVVIAAAVAILVLR